MVLNVLKELQTVTVAVLIFFATVLLALCSLVFLPYKFLVKLTAKMLRPDLRDMVSGGLNVSFTLGTPEYPTANLCVYFVIDGNMDLDVGRTAFRNQVLQVKSKDGSLEYAKLQQVLTTYMGYTFFKIDPTFDLKNHFREYDYDGDLAVSSRRVSEKDLEELMGKLLVAPWIRDRSNWEFLLIRNYYYPDGATEGKTVAVFRINHALADGYSIQRLILRFLGIDKPWTYSQRESGSSWSQKILNCLLFPFKLLYDTAEQNIQVITSRNGWANGDENCQFYSAISPPTSVQVIKRIKNRLGVSYMSVVLAAVLVALNRALTESGRIAPKRISCVVPFPKPNHPGGMTNHTFVGLLSFPIIKEATEEAVRGINQTIINVSKSFSALGMEILLELNSHLPRCIFRLLYKLSGADVILGIFPVLPESFYWKQCRILACVTGAAVLGSSAPFGVVIALSGIEGIQRVSVVARDTVFPSREGFQDIGRYIEEEFVTMSRKFSV